MIKWPSIDQFRQVIRNVRENSAYHGLPLPTVEFEGTVKLHGSNGSLRVTENGVRAFSRERECTIEQDNAGWAHFVNTNDYSFDALTSYILDFNHPGSPFEAGRYTIYGEWCGGSIQAKVGLNKLDKHFVVFGAYDHTEEKFLNRNWMRGIIANPTLLNDFNAVGIWFVYQIPTYSITIDFSQPETAIERLEALTLQIEEECPWAAFRGATGIGEGLVWASVNDTGDFRYWFKTKGVKHQGKDDSKVKTLSVDPAKVAAIRELVSVLLPEWRLEQGVTYLRENGYSFDQKATGQYLQWVMKDVLKEEADTITANPWEWKELTPYLTTAARDYFFKALNRDL